MALERIVCPDEGAWLKEREKSIGASEAAAALGANPYCSPEDLWAQKVGLAEKTFSSRAKAKMRWGTYLEPVIAAHYGIVNQVVPKLCGKTIYRRSERPWLHATPDAICEANGVSWLVEIKTGERHVWEEGVPLYYQIQVQIQLATLEVAFGTIAVLIDGWQYQEFSQHRHDAFLATALPRLEDFWRHVQTKTPLHQEAA